MKQCILCKQPAGSKEHVFPAAFGGRRMNKGIYCQKHNKELGIHVEALLDPLELLNARLGVRSDHHKAPKPYVFNSEDSTRYQLLRSDVEIAPPLPLTQTPEYVGRTTSLRFANETQRDQWLTEQRKHGFKVKAESSSPAEQQFFARPMRFALTLGTPEFRPVAYLGLTYLAHYFPTLAHQQGLAAVKAYVLGAEDDERVWWVDPARCAPAIGREFEVGHTVIVTVSRTTGKAMAQVSFFNILSLAVDLGDVETLQTECVTTHINPLAEQATANVDIVVRRERDVENVVAGNALEGRNYLRAVVDGKVPNPVVEILERMHADHLDQAMLRIQESLADIKALSPMQRHDRIQAVVDAESQQVFNLLQFGVSEFVAQNTDFPAPLRRALECLIAEDSTTSTGLSVSAMAALALAKSAVAEQLRQQLETETLTNESLKLLFAGGPGIAATTAPVLYAMLGSIGAG